MALELSELHSFLVLTQHLHFGQAAEVLRVSQPALTKQIQRLEAKVGGPLLIREYRRVTLTPAGAILRDRAGSLLREAETQARGKPLPVEIIVDCMIRPPFLLGLQRPDFHTLLARSLFMPPPFLHKVLHREFEPNVRAFIIALRRSLPNIPEDLISLRTMFSMGALLMFSMQMGKLCHARNPKFDECLLKEMVRFIAAGLQSDPAVPAKNRPPIPRFPKPRA